MGYPQHPETIVIKNEFYPKGLREIDIWNHYQFVKKKLLNEVKGRDLMFIVMIDINKPIIRRVGKETKYIRLTNANYDDIIHGRAVSIHSAMRRLEDIAIVDVDSDNFALARKAAGDCYSYIMRRLPFVVEAQIRFTGRTGFHIVCKMKKKTNIDSIRVLLKKTLSGAPELANYTFEQKRTSGKVNIDFAPNKFRGNFITLHALSTIGLRCMEVKYAKLRSFTQRDAKAAVR